jgi:cytochrome c
VEVRKMKKVFLTILGLFFVASTTFAADGKTIFQSKGCASCHNPTADTVGPSLKKIASAYKGKENELIAFLKGQHKAIVDPAKFPIMMPQLNTTKKLSDDELKALAEFILSH